MNRLVVDASAVVEYLLRTPRGERVEAAIRLPDADLHAPALCDVEVAAVVRRGRLSGCLGARRAAEVLGDYLDLPFTRHGHQHLMGRVLELRNNFSAYDATYVALAEVLGAALVTTDERLASATREHLDIGVL